MMSFSKAPRLIREGDVMLAKPKHFEPRPEGAGGIGHHPVVVLTYPDMFGKVKVASMSHSHPNNPPQRPTSLFNLPRDPVKGEGTISVGEPKIIDCRMLKVPSLPTAMRHADFVALKAEILKNITDETALNTMAPQESFNETVFGLSTGISPDEQNHLTSSFGILETDKISGQLVAKHRQKPEESPEESYHKNLFCFSVVPEPERHQQERVYPSVESGFSYHPGPQVFPQHDFHLFGSFATHGTHDHGSQAYYISPTLFSHHTSCENETGTDGSVKNVNAIISGHSRDQIYSHTLLRPIYISAVQPPIASQWPILPDLFIKEEP
ncbi:hypothetical protein NLJ89_g5712 [Agrocybe chaxingu]|uniref:Uncharacterized protein n=1 Tax=Agrocybe chaxingu TaxID=84603 RepID=A0A9W8K0K1_9AGAR|nr:hypothetical protein NLJ89_g5712 [Agrocybe chaxingu]